MNSEWSEQLLIACVALMLLLLFGVMPVIVAIGNMGCGGS